ncbi:hypothetical protein P3339_16250 [Microbulbifer sp. MLAF003]|uniref:hypothetical protein n=1 Tax=Microbulbifer sp. MLAF003 TaxID=3032582 RepID=UPI0024AE32F6|nr:hypothetical protein [Microbulbifer sp. MLAF003]WHI49992.1 hypothetical protein P3339_16250 [Microbulbifer sp. MLAF003]
MISSHAALDSCSVMTLFCVLDFYFRDEVTFNLGGRPLYGAVENYFEPSKYFTSQEPSVVKDELFKWLVEESAFSPERQGRAVYQNFTMRDLAILVDIGKKHKVRPKALFCAVAIQSSRILPNHRDWIKVLLPLDVRELYGAHIGLSAVGAFSAVTRLEVMPDIDVEDTWQLARYLQVELDR